jgi:hypothetical protein
MDMSEQRRLDPTADLLRRAKAVVEEKWWRGSAARPDEAGDCPVLAIAKVAGGRPMGAVERFMRAIGATDLIHVYTWNDDPERTKAQVLAAFDAAIAGDVLLRTCDRTKNR